MMSGKTARNMYSTENNKEYCISCILLVVFKNRIGKMQLHTVVFVAFSFVFFELCHFPSD